MDGGLTVSIIVEPITDQQKALDEVGQALRALALGDWDGAKRALWRAGDAAERVTRRAARFRGDE
jgi:hypothetical protein